MPYSDKETETKIEIAKLKINKIVDEYSTKSKGKENLGKQERMGIKILQSRISRKEIVCFPTDKSGRLSIDVPDNYIESMKPHLDSTSKVDAKQYENVERTLNGHMSAWCRILNGDERTSSNFQATNNAVPPLYGLRKDHKPCENQVKGAKPSENQVNETGLWGNCCMQLSYLTLFVNDTETRD